MKNFRGFNSLQFQERTMTENGHIKRVIDCPYRGDKQKCCNTLNPFRDTHPCGKYCIVLLLHDLIVRNPGASNQEVEELAGKFLAMLR